MTTVHLSIAQKLALKPWFGDEVLQEGAKILAGQVDALFYRQTAGLLLGEDQPVTATLCFQPTDRIAQGFRITDRRCSCRRAPRKDQSCGHLAALALAMLDRHAPDEWHPRPLPLLFPGTAWQKLGSFLFDQYDRQVHFRLREEDDGVRLRFHHQDRPLLDCLLPLTPSRQLRALFPDRWAGAAVSPLPADKDLADLFRSLRRQSMTETEAALRKAGRESRGLERDSSLWLWLGRFLASELGPAALRVHQDHEGDFSLFAESASSPTLRFSLNLTRTHTPALLASLAAIGEEIAFLPPAKEFFRAQLAPDSSLGITPCLRLADGRVFTRRELAPRRYGHHYYLEGEGFLPVTPARKECDLRPAAAQPTLFAPAPAGRDLPVTIANRDIPAFIEGHRGALACPDNEVDADLLAAPGRERPDRLEFMAAEEDDHWYYLSGHYRIGNRRIFLTDLIEARHKGLSYLPGSGLRLTGTSLAWFHDLGPERLWRRDGEVKGMRLRRQELLRLAAVIDQVDLPADGGDRLRQLLAAGSWQHAALPACPDHLRDYQRHGLAWLFQLHGYGLGGILADDMGLGKTHQALGLFWLLVRRDPERRFLVVCPATVAPHWVQKLERFYPELSCCLYHGPDRDLGRALAHQVLITTYGILRQDGERLAATPFEAVVFDEMQQLKNNKTAVYQAARLLQGRAVIGLTGTPLENSVRDLKALFDLCLPGALGSDAGFARHYVAPIAEQGSKEKQEELARLLNPFFLRRDRRQVLTELPEVIDDMRTCELSPDQVGLYREAVGREGEDLIARMAAEREVPYLEVLALIGTLKQICDHPALLDPDQDDPHRYASGKWDLFAELLAECLAGSMKVVVFSQYTRMLDLIERYLAGEGIDFERLRGSMTLKARAKAVSRFNEDPSCRVFCASLLASGTGIDLTAAQAVIHYDRWWNAAKEDQATARVHRLGQRRTVQVLKLVTVGTLEEKIHRLIENKRDLAGQLVRADDAAMVKQLTREDLAELLHWTP